LIRESFWAFLDKHKLLDILIWEFSSRSYRQQYGQTYLREVVLRHPVRAWLGLQRYRRLVRQGGDQGPVVDLDGGVCLERFREKPGRCLVALGYCEKPLRGCPSGRFNHRCLYLDEGAGKYPAGVCLGCRIQKTAQDVLPLGLNFHIMTSAEDIARDILIPTLKAGRFMAGVFFLCPYSAEAFIWPLYTCGIASYLVYYHQGNCQNYAQFIAADQGDKPQRTRLAAKEQNWWQKFLSLLPPRPWPPQRFVLEGNIYVPQEAPASG